jgi:hypothetical protein
VLVIQGGGEPATVNGLLSYAQCPAGTSEQVQRDGRLARACCVLLPFELRPI